MNSVSKAFGSALPCSAAALLLRFANGILMLLWMVRWMREGDRLVMNDMFLINGQLVGWDGCGRWGCLFDFLEPVECRFNAGSGYGMRSRYECGPSCSAGFISRVYISVD